MLLIQPLQIHMANFTIAQFKDTYQHISSRLLKSLI